MSHASIHFQPQINRETKTLDVYVGMRDYDSLGNPILRKFSETPMAKIDLATVNSKNEIMQQVQSRPNPPLIESFSKLLDIMQCEDE